MAPSAFEYFMLFQAVCSMEANEIINTNERAFLWHHIQNLLVNGNTQEIIIILMMPCEFIALTNKHYTLQIVTASSYMHNTLAHRNIDLPIIYYLCSQHSQYVSQNSQNYREHLYRNGNPPIKSRILFNTEIGLYTANGKLVRCGINDQTFILHETISSYKNHTKYLQNSRK